MFLSHHVILIFERVTGSTQTALTVSPGSMTFSEVGPTKFQVS